MKIFNHIKPVRTSALLSFGVFLFIILDVYLFKIPIEKFWVFVLVLFIQLVCTLLIFAIETQIAVEKRSRVLYDLISRRKKTKNTIESDQKKLSSNDQDVLDWLEKYEKEAKTIIQPTDNREFLGNVSHELKTPIFNIQGYIMTLLDGGLEDPLINYDYLKRCENSIDRMISIINDLEIINKYEDQQVPLVNSDFDMAKLVKDCFLDFELVAEENRVALIFRKESEDSRVSADQNQLRQVLHNLISNALRYHGEEEPYIKITLSDQNKKLLVTVSDNGIGIEQKDLPYLFDRFYRADKARSRSKGGTGLGLSIVKHIVEAHNQTIVVKSELGRGTSFSFTLDKS